MKIKNLLPYALRQLPPARQHGGMAKEVKIGMAIDDLRLERWQKDRDIFVNKAESLGAKVLSSPLMAMKKRRCRKLKT